MESKENFIKRLRDSSIFINASDEFLSKLYDFVISNNLDSARNMCSEYIHKQLKDVKQKLSLIKK